MTDVTENRSAPAPEPAREEGAAGTSIAAAAADTSFEQEFAGLSDEAIALVRRWLTAADDQPVDASAQQLAGVLKDPNGLDFTVGFVDGVVRPEDLTVAARNLARLAPKVPAFLPVPMRAAVRLGGIAAPILPGVVIPIARKVLRQMVSHLIVDATDQKLGAAIAKIKRDDVRLNVNLLGEAVLGQKEASRRLAGTHALLARDDVDYVSIKVSSTVNPHSPWAFDEDVDHVVESLTPLFERAAAASTPKFINLDMEEYKDLDLTIAVFTRILDRPEFHDLEAGIVLQAYLPDALSAMMRLQEWAAARRATGGAAIKVRIVKGANLPMEQVEASLHDWPLATWGSKQDSDTNYKRVVDYALHPDRVKNVRIGVAGHNLFDIAFAWLLAGRRGARDGIEFEMLLGMAQGQAAAVKKDVGSLLLYTPVVHPQEFDVAIAYLIRRLEEGASSSNFMSAVFELSANEELFEREKNRFLASLADLDRAVPGPNRTQNRQLPAAAAPIDTFENTPDTDPSLPANRAWARDILSRVADTRLGIDTLEASTVTTKKALTERITTATQAAGGWAARGGDGRAELLHRVGDVLEQNRARLIEVMAAETGKTVDQADPEISEAIDFAHFYAEQARELDRVDGATFVPARLTVVAPPWNFPVAIPAGSALAALAAGSSVIMKPAPQASRCGAVLADALWEAGIPADVFQLVQVDEGALGRELIAHPNVDRVILTGGYETAELFRSFRHDLPLLAETSGKNAIIVAPSADIDLAVKDVVNSAFGHAGQKCSAASLVILVGSVARSRRFHDQLVDAVSSLTVGYPTDATTQMGPVIEPAAGKLLSGLTELGAGESWLVQPQKLDDTGRLWSPGIRDGVRRGSTFHKTEYFGPILGIMTAATLDEAIAMQNEVDYGLTAGLHSLDPADLEVWLADVAAGNLYINRGITGAIVRRQPFGGWKKSAVGPGTKAGGPNYLVGLGSWQSDTASASTPVTNPDVAALRDAALASGALDATSGIPAIDRLERSLASDADAWATRFGTATDVSGLSAERNVFRYLPRHTAIRLSEGELLTDLVRVVAAAFAAGARPTVSVPEALPSRIQSVLEARELRVTVESDEAFLARAGRSRADRVRLIGGSVSALAAATGGRPDLGIYGNPVTESGRIELLPFLQEQAVSITAHRFGTPNALSEGLI